MSSATIKERMKKMNEDPGNVIKDSNLASGKVKTEQEHDYDPSTVKRLPNKINDSQLRTDDEDDQEVGTDRNKEINQLSKHDLVGVNRFDADQ